MFQPATPEISKQLTPSGLPPIISIISDGSSLPPSAFLNATSKPKLQTGLFQGKANNNDPHKNFHASIINIRQEKSTHSYFFGYLHDALQFVYHQL